MGLDFTFRGENRPTPHWGYIGFMWFRKKLAQEIGVNLDEMYGFEPWRMFSSNDPGEKEGRSWSTVKDPIKYLLYHSDCEGQIGPRRCAMIAPRLRELTKDWPKPGELRGRDAEDKEKAAQLADVMEECFRLNVPLIFT